MFVQCVGAYTDLTEKILKGRDQREVWGVEIIYKRSVWVWDRGDRNFLNSFSPHLVLNIFPFPLAPAKIIGDVQMNR